MLFKKFSKNFIKSNLFKFPSFAFASAAEKLPTLEGKPAIKKGEEKSDSTTIQPWVEVENRLSKLRSELVLSDQGKIENYVLSVIKGYFRTTYKDGLTLESKLSDHGLDSLDSIELGMVLEDELGYIIEAETLPQFTKVKHFVNYIKQIEAYKREYFILPQVRALQPDETWNDWIPGGEKLREKLRKFTKDGKNEKKETKKTKNH
jgi:acyl carrier protein